MGNKIKLTESQLKGLITRVANRILKENKNYKHPNLSLEQLKQKYPEIKFTMNKKGEDRYFVRADIETQGGEMEYLGALKGSVSGEEGLKWLNNIASNKYDDYY